MTDKEKELSEKLDAAIEAGLKLNALATGVFEEGQKEWNKAVNTLRSLKPKPERLRSWVNVRKTGACYSHWVKGSAEESALMDDGYARIAVPMIEVAPLPPMPELEEWDGILLFEKRRYNGMTYRDDVADLSNIHNATIAKCREWMELVRKEIEG